MKIPCILAICLTSLLATAASGAPPTDTAPAKAPAAAPAAPAPAAPAAGHRVINDSDLKWSPAASLPPGGEMAILDGDPAKPGMFTIRFRVSGNYGIPPHWHPADEHVTVISGSVWMGMGEKFDESTAHEVKAGGFAVMPTPMRHYAFMRGPTVLQVHGMGPWGITYVNPADDPRTAPATASVPKR